MSRGIAYTPDQIQAIEAIDTNLQIIACAGSGKTQVVSRRIVEILRKKRSEGITPANIVAFTFTEKAAAELKDRIHAQCQEVLGEETGLAEMFVGTIHAWCHTILQRPPVYKYFNYSVLSDIQQRLLIDRHWRQCGAAQCTDLQGNGLKRYTDTALYIRLL